ncbi:MAG: class III extradiol ring-cleavage dioxygenase [Gallionella sp.]
MKMPTLFVSHGAPTLPLEPGETGAAWQKIAAFIPKPSAILVISAHWETDIPTVSSVVQPETIHDFSGFPQILYELQYPAPGAPELAKSIVELLQQAGIPVRLSNTRGLDHGVWVPLSLMYSAADIPVTQLSLQPNRNPAWHIALGRALQSLREQGVLIIGSGSITHNLRAIFQHRQGDVVPSWVTEFCDWIAEKIKVGDVEALSNYRNLAPHAVQNHPTDEHLLPLFVALGAAGSLEAAQRINHVMTYGFLAMDAWVFDWSAAESSTA